MVGVRPEHSARLWSDSGSTRAGSATQCAHEPLLLLNAHTRSNHPRRHLSAVRSSLANRCQPSPSVSSPQLDFSRNRSRTIVVRVALSILVCLLSCGCAARHGDLACCDPCPAPHPVANLALGPSREVLTLADAFVGRSLGPAVDIGYTLEDASLFSDVQLDAQYSFGRFGGFARYAQSARFVTFVR